MGVIISYNQTIDIADSIWIFSGSVAGSMLAVVLLAKI